VTTSIIVALGALSPLVVPSGIGLYWFARRRRAMRKALSSA
jgi:hypothetical protein